MLCMGCMLMADNKPIDLDAIEAYLAAGSHLTRYDQMELLSRCRELEAANSRLRAGLRDLAAASAGTAPWPTCGRRA